MQKVRQEIIEDESLSELPNGALMISLAKAIKLIHITWNVKNEELFGLNVLYIDAGIIYHQDAGFCAFFWNNVLLERMIKL